MSLFLPQWLIFVNRIIECFKFGCAHIESFRQRKVGGTRRTPDSRWAYTWHDGTARGSVNVTPLPRRHFGYSGPFSVRYRLAEFVCARRWMCTSTHYILLRSRCTGFFCFRKNQIVWVIIFVKKTKLNVSATGRRRQTDSFFARIHITASRHSHYLHEPNKLNKYTCVFVFLRRFGWRPTRFTV